MSLAGYDLRPPADRRRRRKLWRTRKPRDLRAAGFFLYAVAVLAAWIAAWPC